MSALLDKRTYEHRFISGTIINHLLYMNEIKLYAKNEQDIDLVIHLNRVFRSDIGITFGLAKCDASFQPKKGEEHLWNQPTSGSDR